LPQLFVSRYLENVTGKCDIFENRLWGARETVFWGVVCIQISFFH